MKYSVALLKRMLGDLREKRQSGFTLIEIVLVLAVGLGLIVGGVVFFQQAQVGSEVTDKTRSAVAISSEVRAQYRTQTTFGADGTAITTAVFNAASFPASVTNNVAIEAEGATGQQFILTFSNLSEDACTRMGAASNIDNLGANVESTDVTACATTGTLAITYNR
jgi:prepilin-type N-terminal cleavage/methylation domain-containing protein